MFEEDPRLTTSTLYRDTGVKPEWRPEPLPGTLTSSQTKLVYLYLQLQDTGTVEELREALGMKTITLYPVLERLVDLGLVQRDGDRYVCQAT